MPRDIERGDHLSATEVEPVSNALFDRPLIERDANVCISCDAELEGLARACLSSAGRAGGL